MIVLDTHALVWWIGNPKRLSATARKAIDAAVAANGALVSCISTWEVAMLSLRGRLELALDVSDWLARVEALPYLRFVPVDNATALRSVLLPEPLHRDPADRIIIATALAHGAAVVTVDDKLRSYPHVRTMW